MPRERVEAQRDYESDLHPHLWTPPLKMPPTLTRKSTSTWRVCRAQQVAPTKTNGKKLLLLQMQLTCCCFFCFLLAGNLGVFTLLCTTVTEFAPGVHNLLLWE